MTALGQSREKSQVGTSVQQINTQELTQTKAPDIVSQIAGKVSGVQITGTGAPGGSSMITIRGSNSITGDNTPLFIVDGVPIAKSDYVELFAALLSGRVVRQDPQAGAAVRIFGPLEARLTDNDRVVLGGLVEGTWPPESNSDAWLSRSMRLTLGLDLPSDLLDLTD